jgi:hypothetical protein
MNGTNYICISFVFIFLWLLDFGSDEQRHVSGRSTNEIEMKECRNLHEINQI